MMTTVIIDPRIKYNYASWYLLGLRKLYGRKNIIFDITPFKELSYRNREEYNSGIPLLIKKNNTTEKIFLDTEDVAKIFKDRYEWCDTYGMVNPTKEQIEKYRKLVPTGPEFGITIGNKFNSVLLCVCNFLKSFKYSNTSLKELLKDYLYTNIRRREIGQYEKNCNIKENYIFHASTLWYNKFAASDTNMYRGEFLKACQKAKIEIEGGLFYINGAAVLEEMPDYPKYKETYKDFIYERRLSMDDYILKTKQSVVVFNTPSVCECHGWKLAEYLCMGKAIISTPLTRELPGKGLVHGENVHFVHSAEDIYDAVIKINTDSLYRKKLERGARAYYDEWLAPEVVVRRLIEERN